MPSPKNPTSISLPTIAGSAFSNLKKVFSIYSIEPQFTSKKYLSALVSLFGEPIRWYEEHKYNSRLSGLEITEGPVFILGHWRSGTTYLHNLLCQDPQMGYVTTYQGVFPNVLFSGKWLFKNFMKAAMPKRRANDNVELSPDFPQEEELALGNMNPYCFYYFWYFPNEIRELYNKYVRFNIPEAEKERWKKDYITLLKKAMLNTGKKCIVSKNPPNTGRIKILLEMFPNAKFIHIYRNPVSVFRSTLKLHLSTLPLLQFQTISEEQIEDNILHIYKEIMQDYLTDKLLIPPQNLIELKYEDVVQSPFEYLRQIYQSLGLPGFENAAPYFQSYIQSQQAYIKNSYSISNAELEKVAQHWGFAMKEWGYEGR